MVTHQMEAPRSLLNSITKFQKLVVPDNRTTTEAKQLINDLLTWFIIRMGHNAALSAQAHHRQTVQYVEIQLAVQQTVEDDLLKEV